MNNARTEPRSNANIMDSGRNAEPAYAGSCQPPPYSSPLDHQAMTVATTSRKRSPNEFDEDDDWPLNADEEYRAEAEAIKVTTPRKSLKTEQFTTPGRHNALEYGNSSLPTPETGGSSTLHRSLFGAGNDYATRKHNADSDFLNLVSPATTPTPVRFRDVNDGGPDGELYKDITLALEKKNAHLSDEATSTVRQVCARYDLKAQGIAKG
jgi:hypothetical protein